MRNDKVKERSITDQIENIDIRIQEMLASKDSKDSSGRKRIDAEVEELVQQKRTLQKMASASGERSMDWMESNQLFHGEDVSQRKQQFKFQAQKILEEITDVLNRLDTKARSNPAMMGQDMSQRINELKSMKERMADMALEMPRKTDDEFGGLRIAFEDTLQNFKELYQQTNRQFA